MEPVVSGRGQEQPSEQCLDLVPSSKGRQRKRNSKYHDYETDYNCVSVEGLPQAQPRESSGGGGAATPTKTSRRGRKPKNATQQPADEEKEATDKTAQGSDEKTSEETPKKTARARKTPSQMTLAAVAATAAGGAVGPAQQENGTPKPKRKYVKKQREQGVTPSAEARVEPPVTPEEETEPGGRRRRSAAKAALKYLHILAKEMLDHNSEGSSSKPGVNREVTVSEQKTPRGRKGTKGQKRKRPDGDSDAADDEDFVPDAEEEDVEEAEEEEEDDAAGDSDLDLDFGSGARKTNAFRVQRNSTFSSCKVSNGLSINAMKLVWESTETTKKFREEHYSSWVFAEWVPSASAWHRVPQRDLHKYLPEELQSAAFRVSREGLSMEETPLQRLDRFGALPPHPDRWDMLLYAGGPVWAMEWCPTPDGAPAAQYLALACHRGMDDQHHVNKTYTGPGLVQLWDVGQLEYDVRPDSQPSLAYALAQDSGFIWQLKWCPAGGWEKPSRGRKAPFLPRLGLLAVATSNGVVTIYSLPHPHALLSNSKLSDSDGAGPRPPVYKAVGVVTLKLGALKARRREQSGQVLAMDWLPEKPHNLIAIGFYDGTVGLWDLCSNSSLLRLRESDASLSLLPYRCLAAHHHAVRALAFCPASRHLLVTAGEDRYVKTWDLRRAYDPITVQKRYLTNEIYWPLNGPGVLMAQECAYAPKGSRGIHYIDHYFSSVFVMPRTGTVWSLSFTDWMNSVVTADSFGEVIFAVLPPICYNSPYIKRTIERRFPVYFTSLVPYTSGEDHQKTGRVEEDAPTAQEGRTVEDADAQSDKGNENEKGGGGGGAEDEGPIQQFETYREAVKKYWLHHTDYDMRSFVGSERRAAWQRMKDTEMKIKLNLDEMPLAALHKVRFNPNMSCHTWLVSGGQTGLVRLNCLRSLNNPETKKMVSDSQAQFTALYQEDASQATTDEL